ncbi:unnamed protein product [Phytophthora fragariaefolia]|uniref:Unnamed protein product n=1 Tax=Phytophthora fragariaefolia TaxID=1490495 RepID=A0A9W7D0S3_9STRA|nr:unnamed protein product [Phytophthora fragariaefolia]
MQIDRRDIDASARELIEGWINRHDDEGIMNRHDSGDIGRNDARDASMHSQIIRRDGDRIDRHEWWAREPRRQNRLDEHDKLSRGDIKDRHDRHDRHGRLKRPQV